MKQIYFFIGTEAELIKIFPVIVKCQEKGNMCHIIASGQNDLKKNRILDYVRLNGEYLELSSEESIKKNAIGLFCWFFKTKFGAKTKILQRFKKEELQGKCLVVHGDTVSTFLGALIGKKLKMKVCHVEAGLRSHNYFNPFPEEIDRVLTSKIARVHFAPSDEAKFNLIKAKGQVVHTGLNTILDSLLISKDMDVITEAINKVKGTKYFVFVMHRQENLMDKNFFQEIMSKIEYLSKDIRCVVILHKITQIALEEIGLLDKLNGDPNFLLLPRVDYFDFMKLLNDAEFIITDGGSNQEELHYMGKPCLIMRNATERKEGIGTNAILFDGDINIISEFASEYEKYKINEIKYEMSPSEVIAQYLCGK